MSSTANTLSTLNGLFKVVYASELIDAVPDFAVLQKRIAFKSDDKIGAYYAQPINLSQEAGFTYGGETDANAAGLDLNDAVAGAMKEAQVKGSELILRGQLTYKAMSRAAAGGKAAFKKATAWKVVDMNNAMRKRLEIAMLYGQIGVGTVLTNTSGALVLTTGTWAGGIWAGAEGAKLEAFTTNAATATQHDTTLTISAVDADTRTVTVTGTSSSVVANDILFFLGSKTTTGFNEMAGLQKIIANTGSLFAIDASAFSLWKGTTDSSFGVPSFSRFMQSVAKAVNKGLMEKVLLLVSPKCFGVLNSDQAALRMYDATYKESKGAQGFEALVFHSTNGACEIVSHPMVKDGDAFIVPEESLTRIGSADLVFGLGEDEFVQYIANKAVYEVQCFADQAIFCERPAHCVYVSGITY